MTAHRGTHRREPLLGARWVQTVSCYKITATYLILAVAIFVLLLALDG